MEIAGKIIKILPVQSGQGKNGEWKKQEFVIQSDGPYPKNVCFTVWNNKVEIESFKENQMVKVSFDPESREFNSRWYTDLTAWRIQNADENESKNTNDDNLPIIQSDSLPDDSTDDLPF